MINRLQWLNALEITYYASDELAPDMRKEYVWAKRRPDTAHVIVKEAVAEDDERHRLQHTYKPNLNITLELSFSTVRRNQRRVPVHERGKLRPIALQYVDENSPLSPPNLIAQNRTFRLID